MEKGQSIKRHNVADTSKKAYKEIIAEGLPENERILVMSILRQNGPMNSRELAIIAKKERTNMTRAIHELIKLGAAEIHHKDKCPITDRTVNYYVSVENQIGKDECNLISK